MRCRLLMTGALDGPTNMALDEALLLLAGAVPTLRVYTWSAPCLSIGYSQEVGTDVDLDGCRRLGVGLVRRITGGGAILHDMEVTYSLVAAETHPAVSGSVVESYRKVSSGLMAGLASLGVRPELAPISRVSGAASAACFYRPSSYELTVMGRKVAGSAQCRRLGNMLQHGSILLDLDPGRALAVLKPDYGQDRRSWREGFRRRAISLREALGRSVPFEEAAGALAGGFREAMGMDLEPAEPSGAEWELAAKLRREKHADPVWTLERRVVEPAPD